MAISKIGTYRVRDQDGNEYLLYPTTKVEAVKGLQERLIAFEETINDELTVGSKNKINRTDTKTFFIEPSKWDHEGKYIINTTDFGWTEKSILQLNAPSPASNQATASYISIFSHTDTEIVLKTAMALDEPVLITIVYAGENASHIFIEEEIGQREIKYTVKEEQPTRNMLLLIDNEGSAIADSSVNQNALEIVGGAYLRAYVSGSSSYYGMSGEKVMQVDPKTGTTSDSLITVNQVKNFNPSLPWQLDMVFNYVLPVYNASVKVNVINIPSCVQILKDQSVYNRFNIKYTNPSGETVEEQIVSGSGSGTYAYTIQYTPRESDGQLRVFIDGDAKVDKTFTVKKVEATTSGLNIGGRYVHAERDYSHGVYNIDDVRLLQEVGDIPDRPMNIWDRKPRFSAKTVYEVEKTKVINNTEKSFYENRDDGLYKYDKASREWVKQ